MTVSFLKMGMGMGLVVSIDNVFIMFVQSGDDRYNKVMVIIIIIPTSLIALYSDDTLNL